MSQKTISLEEDYGKIGQSKPRTKFYPIVNLPIKIDPSLVGKTIKLVVKAKVVGVREERRNGSKPRQSSEIELQSVVLDSTKETKDGLYIKPWMKDMVK